MTLQRLSTLCALTALAVLPLTLVGCGGSTGGGVSVDTTTEPLSLHFAPVEPMAFSVDFSSESEMRGTAFIASIRYRWEARNWQQDGEAWTCDVTFKNIQAAMRRGSGVGMETLEGFEALEGFSTRYRKDATGFAPVTKPAKDADFMARFGQLQAGLGALDFRSPPSPVRPGESWEEVIDDGSLDAIRSALRDSVSTNTYRNDEQFQGHACARIHFGAKIPMDGVIEAEQGPMAGKSAHLEGRIETEGDELLDKALGFMRSVEGKSKIIINQRELDAQGKAAGPEQSMVQNLNFKIKYLGD